MSARAPAPAGRASGSCASACTFAALVVATSLLTGCATVSSWMPTIPPPSMAWFNWFGSSKKPGPLPEVKGNASVSVAWQVPVGKAKRGFTPAVAGEAIFAAAGDGTVMRVEAATGKLVWRISAGKTLSAGVGADASIVVVGTDKGDVLAFDPNGKPLWQSKVSSEVVSAPNVAEGTVAVWSGDGRVYGLAAADGKTKWVYQRNNPPLTVRNYAGGAISRGGLFVGTAGGKLVALDLATGHVGWEGNVATPKGATELERIADITSLPAIEERQVCAAAFQGRVACFEILRGSLAWSRDVSSLEGIAVDSRHLYVTDDTNNVQAFDKSTGASAWKQDAFAKRRIGGPVLVGDYVGVVDIEGYLQVLDRNDGRLVGRVATDGTPSPSQPLAVRGQAVFQTEGGALVAVGVR